MVVPGPTNAMDALVELSSVVQLCTGCCYRTLIGILEDKERPRPANSCSFACALLRAACLPAKSKKCLKKKALQIQAGPSLM